nr:MAG TPA: hypothetical protein [Bacteriophage sp.]
MPRMLEPGCHQHPIFGVLRAIRYPFAQAE